MQTVQVFNSDKKLVASFETKAEAEAYVAKNQHLVLESSDQQVVRGMFDGAFKFLVIGGAIVAYLAFAFMSPSGPQESSIEQAVSECSYTIKKGLKDPDSYKKRSVIALPLENKGGTRILIQYAAKNSFGGYVVEEAWCDSKIAYVPYRKVF